MSSKLARISANIARILNLCRISHKLNHGNGNGHGNGYDQDCCGSAAAASTTSTMVTMVEAMDTDVDPMRVLDRPRPHPCRALCELWSYKREAGFTYTRIKQY